ncbi:hypothetical protein OGAPHI_005767 [Ogataea philodendri]|uniref:P-type Cu(+) transporter n=1 Tax=Ogataea philodendri TaxID=1378263 RepID=A0A9P8NZU2_9ASCO|nr:uncharacterized protein OGAPHI_005767 [Ogataea philodendri]KAH3662515.1 hypothetical protein OGAPHI_005767 [Ogataea philodendri]
MQTTLRVEGMTCSACTSAVEASLRELDGVDDVKVALLTEQALVTHSPTVSADALADAVDSAGFGATIEQSGAADGAAGSTETSILTIGGMTCSSCVGAVTDAIRAVHGVQDVQVSLLTEQAVVKHTGSAQKLCEAVEDCGFEATLVETKNGQTAPDLESVVLKVFGMTCANCSASIEQTVSALDGVVSCQVALATEEAHITYDNSRTGIRKIMETIEDCGFDALLNSKLDTASQLDLLLKVKDIAYWRQIFVRMIIFGAPIFFRHHIWPIVALIFNIHWKKVALFHGVFLESILELALATYIQFWLAHRFYVNSFKAIKHKNGTMDLLICVSTTVIYIYSALSILISMYHSSENPPHVLFDTSAMLFVFVSLGKWIESKAKGNTSTALSKLLSLTPPNCLILEDPTDFGSSQREIVIDLLQKNDTVVLPPGSKIPADGECVFGSSEVDESLLTGESLPVVKKPGSKLFGGSINVASPIYMRVDVLGEQTQLSKIVKLVKDAQITKAPVQKFADVIAGKFVVTILVLSVATLGFWSMYVYCHSADNVPSFFVDKDTGRVIFSRILQVAISVVVVACPCALGLAAPTAVMVGTGVGATNGILIKGADILEKANGIDCVVFDKTGTITSGRMRVVSHHFLGDLEASSLWSIIHAVEATSEHPVGKALAAGALPLAKEQAVEIVSVSTAVGFGVEAQIKLDGSIFSVAIGNKQLIDRSKVDNAKDFEDSCKRTQTHEISQFSHILINDRYVGYVELADSLKTDAASTIGALLDAGYTVSMVTGDNANTARTVSRAVGIPLSNVFAQARPDDKLRVVDQMQQRGLKVAFVGDGINDAPALIQADLGIAIASGTDIAIEAADVVMLSSAQPEAADEVQLNDFGRQDGTAGVFGALDISQKTFRSIKTNFVLAVVYNLVMLPIAMGFLIIPFNITMNPMFASAAMACSSVSVVLNSLRLKDWKMPVLTSPVLSEESLDWADDSVLTAMDATKMEINRSATRTWGFRWGRWADRFRNPYHRVQGNV